VFADDRLLLRHALADEFSDDHQPARDADPRCEQLAGRCRQPGDGLDDAQLSSARTARSASSSYVLGQPK
jgi:hypothetical protein